MNILFSIFLRAQGRPGLSLFFGLAGNVLNIGLDYFMIACLGMGLRGAALASGISVLLPMCCGLTTWVFNRVLLSRIGIDGVAAYTIVGYIASVQFMIITGFATGLLCWLLVLVSSTHIAGIFSPGIPGISPIWHLWSRRFPRPDERSY